MLQKIVHSNLFFLVLPVHALFRAERFQVKFSHIHPDLSGFWLMALFLAVTIGLSCTILKFDSLPAKIAILLLTTASMIGDKLNFGNAIQHVSIFFTFLILILLHRKSDALKISLVTVQMYCFYFLAGIQKLINLSGEYGDSPLERVIIQAYFKSRFTDETAFPLLEYPFLWHASIVLLLATLPTVFHRRLRRMLPVVCGSLILFHIGGRVFANTFFVSHVLILMVLIMLFFANRAFRRYWNAL